MLAEQQHPQQIHGDVKWKNLNELCQDQPDGEASQKQVDACH